MTEKEINPNSNRIMMPSSEEMMDKLKNTYLSEYNYGSKIIGISQETDQHFSNFVNSIADKKLSGQDLLEKWLESGNKILKDYPIEIRTSIDYMFKRIADTITPDSRIAEEAKSLMDDMYEKEEQEDIKKHNNPNNLRVTEQSLYRKIDETNNGEETNYDAELFCIGYQREDGFIQEPIIPIHFITNKKMNIVQPEKDGDVTHLKTVGNTDMISKNYYAIFSDIEKYMLNNPEDPKNKEVLDIMERHRSIEAGTTYADGTQPEDLRDFRRIEKLKKELERLLQ